MLKSAALLATLALVAACAGTPPAQRPATQPLTNEQGHVIGHKQGGAVTLYTPRKDASGTVVGYDERVPEGTMMRTLDGRKIGVRYNDLRSRATNPNRDGIGVVVPAAAGASASQ